MNLSPFNLTSAVLVRIERLARFARRRLCRHYSFRRQADRPNNPEEWGALYKNSRGPITRISSTVALAIERLSKPGDLLLETGCGSAVISAELAVAGRRVELADFSQAVLDQAQKLFEESNLPLPRTTLADLTKALPWPNAAVDITWSSGVLEHWTDEELYPILKEMRRISRRRVISLVPFAGSLLYRWGKWHAEMNGTWPYGRELPRQSLRTAFEKAGLLNINETLLCSDQALGFLTFIDEEIYHEAQRWWSSVPPEDILRQTQGYLLLTSGDVPEPRHAE